MERIWTTELSSHTTGEVRLAGWLHRLRHLGGVSFLIVRDGRGTAQVVIEDPGLIARLTALSAESVVLVDGIPVESPRAPRGVELRATRVCVLSEATDPPPFDLFRPEVPALLPTALDHAAIALRHTATRDRFRLMAAALRGFRRTLDGLGFTEVSTPKIVGTATESGANVFQIDYFGRAAYLAQSPQFYKQMLVGVFERVYEVGPVFRAEPHDTPRHLNEYVSLDAEMGFIADHHTVMATLTAVIAGMIDAMREIDAFEQAAREPERLAVPSSMPEIQFSDALRLISRETSVDRTGEVDLSPGDEQWLGDWARREHGSEFLFVTGFPMAKRPFYTHPDPERPEYSNSFDLLFRGLEIVTGGQRLHRYESYLAALHDRGLEPEPFTGYLEAFKHGMPPHGGFALGIERFIARLTGVANVRETTLFPRDLNRLTP